MLYSAMCLSNTDYFAKGTIKVRIFEYYSVPRRKYNSQSKKVEDTGVDDLSKNAEELTRGDNASLHDGAGISADFEAMVFAPLGGGRNYGMMALPKTNEKGVVAFLDGMFGKPIWMGSYFQPIRDPNDFNTIKAVNVPNEDPLKEGADSDGAKDGATNSDEDGDQNSIVLRTKTTTPDASDGDKMDWESTDNTSTENLIVIDSNKIRIRHFSEWDGTTPKKWQEIKIFNDGSKDTVQIEVKDEEADYQGLLKIQDDAFEIALYEGDEVKAQISGNQDTIDINGDEDTTVLYSKLREIVEALINHVHAGAIVTGPPLNPDKSPMSTKVDQPKVDMEADKVQSKHWG